MAVIELGEAIRRHDPDARRFSGCHEDLAHQHHRGRPLGLLVLSFVSRAPRLRLKPALVSSHASLPS